MARPVAGARSDLVLPKPRFPVVSAAVGVILLVASIGTFGMCAFDAFASAAEFERRVVRLEELRGEILRLDEVLTMSARMAAATGDPAWEARYRSYEGPLNETIEAALAIAPSGQDEALQRTLVANEHLVEMEKEAFRLVGSGNLTPALQLLASDDYALWKKEYRDGTEVVLEGIASRLAERTASARRTVSLTLAAGVPLALGACVSMGRAAWVLAYRNTATWRDAVRREADDREAALERVREAESRFRDLADNVESVLTLETLGGGSNLYASPAYDRLFGTPRAGLQSDAHAWVASVHPDDRERVRHEVTSPSEPLAVEFRIVRPGGEVRWVRSRAFPVRGAGANAARVATIFDDITEAREAEEIRRDADRRERELDEARRLERATGHFVNTVAHELNNPLTPLVLQFGLLQDPARRTGPVGDRAIEVIRRNLSRLQGLLRDVLDVARIRSNQLAVRMVPCSLRELGFDVVEGYAPVAEQAGIKLELVAEKDAEVTADPARLSQVITNFVSNALKFTPAGGHVTVRVANDGGACRLEVRDTGPGMTSEQIARLFAPFSQLDYATKTDKGGAGLGLFISKGIVERHGGRIWCESDGPGHGALFAFTVPNRAAIQEPTPRPEQA